MSSARESNVSRSKTRENEWEQVITVDGTTDPAEAISKAYGIASTALFGFPRKAGEALRWVNRGIAEVTFSFGLSQDKDEDDPQGDQPTIGTLQIVGAGTTQHVTTCISQTSYPEGKGAGLVDAKVVGWHSGGVNGTDIHVNGSRYIVTKRWLPAAISGTYLDGLDDLQGKTNQSSYTIQWGFNKTAYSLQAAGGELLFLNYDAKTSFTQSGIGVWEISYEMLRLKNRSSFDVGKNKDGTAVTIASKKGHEYLWVVYEPKNIDNPKKTIEVPQMAFVSKVYEDADFKAKLGF